MTLEEQLAQEIKAQYRSVRQFALCHGINYSQLTSALKRGIAGAGVESMLTVFNALGLDIESVRTGKLVRKGPANSPPKQNTAASEPDTAANIAKRYGGLDYHGKMAVCAVMTAEERRLDDSAVYQFEAVAKGGQQNGARAINVEDVARCAEIAAKISAESSDDM